MAVAIEPSQVLTIAARTQKEAVFVRSTMQGEDLNFWYFIIYENMPKSKF